MSSTIVRTKPRSQPRLPSRLRFGPADHGRTVNPREIETAEYIAGFKYEIIDGRLYVSPVPNIPENRLEAWLHRYLLLYSEAHPEIINYVTTKGRVFLPQAVRTTSPEPDLAAYANFPIDDDHAAVNWEDVSPIVVVEILVEGDIEKDLGRNPPLYLAVPSIREYWVVDGSINAKEPSLIQHVRRGKKWSVTTHPFGATFTPKVLPGFSLVIDPRKR